MIRPLVPLIAIVALAGCQQPGPATDPFLYRSTIPPPGTAIATAPVVTPGPQPYYSAPPAAAPGPAPCTPDTPAPIVQPAPVVPAPAPVVPVLPPRYFPSRGGFDFPQSSNGPPPAAGTGGGPPPLQQLATNPSTTGAAAVGGIAPSVVRIVEPSVQHSVALPADGRVDPIVSSGTPTNPSRASPSPAPSQSVVLASAVLPVASGSTTAISPPGSSTNVSYPGDHPGVTYGYDSGYKALRGKLDYSVTARLWRLRYLPPDGPTDEYGGTVVIADSHQVNGFEPGDFVSAQGSLSPPSAGATSPLYAISRIKRQ